MSLFVRRFFLFRDGTEEENFLYFAFCQFFSEENCTQAEYNCSNGTVHCNAYEKNIMLGT